MSRSASYSFEWKDLGNLAEGRPNLGSTMNVAVYRLMQYTLRDVMAKRLSAEQCSVILRDAGELAGREFCRNILDCSLPFNGFVSSSRKSCRSSRSASSGWKVPIWRGWSSC